MTRSRIGKQAENTVNQVSDGAASGNGEANGTVPERSDGATNEAPISDPIAAAEMVQESLRTALAGTNRLIQLLRRNRKQAKLVETTLASLRELQSAS